MNLTAIAIVAIVCWCIVELANSVKAKKSAKISDRDKQALEQEVAKLNERIETLERIVTDEKYQLKREFDSLKQTG